MPANIYPPILLSTQPAFLYTTSGYKIYFSLQSLTSFKDIGHAQVRIVRQTDNQSIANKSKYPDGNIYKIADKKEWQNEEDGLSGNKYALTISAEDDLQEKWRPGSLYKVQVRFGSTPTWKETGQAFAKWKQEQIDKGTFSEWSTVMIIKAITKPEVVIENARHLLESGITYAEQPESTLNPLFWGSCVMEAADREIEDMYKFDLYKGQKSENDESGLVETSGWLQHNAIVNSLDSHRFKRILESRTDYTLFYTIKTNNGYIEAAQPYLFQAVETYLDDLQGIYLSVESNTLYCRDNACINIYLSSDQELNGVYVLTRASEKTNYQVWEDLKYLPYNDKKFAGELIYQDFTIESGIKYRYALQMENRKGLRTSPIYDSQGSIHMVNFEYAYLYHDKVQLRLMFNNKMNTFKHTVLQAKQDTLGGKYPHVTRNGQAYYAEFPINGLISFQMDPSQTFMTLNEEGFYFPEFVEETVDIPRDKFVEDSIGRLSCAEGGGASNLTNRNELTINSSLTDDNTFVERKFRERVEQFLNNFDYKLFKSPTEGNIVVVLQNVSMSPNETLGRMIYEFSATAYEVLDNTLDNLNQYGIIDIGGYTSYITEHETFLSFGQLQGLYTTSLPINLFKLIEEQESRVGEGYKIQVKNIQSIWVERYPQDKENFEKELLELQARRVELINSNQSTLEIDVEIQKTKNLIDAINEEWFDDNIFITIGEKNILIQPRRIYNSRNEITKTLSLTKSSYPILVNYVCEMERVEDTSVPVVVGVYAAQLWGQEHGIFADKSLEESIFCSENGMGWYNTLDLYSIIQEATKKQVDNMSNSTEEDIDYSFSGLASFSIEAPTGTELLIGRQESGKDAITVKVGPTGKYTLNPSTGMVRYIRLKKTAFAIIDYVSMVIWRRLERG